MRPVGLGGSRDGGFSAVDLALDVDRFTAVAHDVDGFTAADVALLPLGSPGRVHGRLRRR